MTLIRTVGCCRTNGRFFQGWQHQYDTAEGVGRAVIVGPGVAPERTTARTAALSIALAARSRRSRSLIPADRITRSSVVITH
jgi:hypothetical protein